MSYPARAEGLVNSTSEREKKKKKKKKRKKQQQQQQQKDYNKKGEIEKEIKK